MRAELIVEDQLDRRVGRIGVAEKFPTAMAIDLAGDKVGAGQQADRAVAPGGRGRWSSAASGPSATARSAQRWCPAHSTGAEVVGTDAIGFAGQIIDGQGFPCNITCHISKGRMSIGCIMNLTTRYMGLDLKTPLVSSASPMVSLRNCISLGHEGLHWLCPSHMRSDAAECCRDIAATCSCLAWTTYPLPDKRPTPGVGDSKAGDADDSSPVTHWGRPTGCRGRNGLPTCAH
jgi:hypothetical protein